MKTNDVNYYSWIRGIEQRVCRLEAERNATPLVRFECGCGGFVEADNVGDMDLPAFAKRHWECVVSGLVFRGFHKAR